MRRTILWLAGTLTLVAIAGSSGCSTDPGEDTTTGGTTSTGGSSGQAGTATGQSGSGVGGAPNCSPFTPCGGSVVGSWKVASSCLKLSGDMDTKLLSLGCPSVPVTGSLQVEGTFVANADGTYRDNTTTSGSVSFPLSPACLSVSSVAVACDRIGSIFEAAGWDTANCTGGDGQCNCTLNVDKQKGGLGAVVPYTETAGMYTTSGNSLTATNVTYSYCAAGDTLNLVPQVSGTSGSVVLTREGAGGSGAGGGGGQGGAGGQGGSAGGGQGGSGGSPPTGMQPCDIYKAANNTCVAAHSTIRALFSAYAGNLYQIERASDKTTKDIPVKSPGGYADSAQQEAFCMGTTCTILRVYDQSEHGNFIEAEIPGSTVGGAQGQKAANAAQESLTVGGNKVYSLYTRPQQAYWRDGSKSGMPLGAEPQGIYMVTSGKHVSGGCCYNYGNGQLDRLYKPGPRMDAVYFGTSTQWGSGAGTGPWVMADMEDGMLSGPDSGKNPNLPSMPYTYVTAIEKNDGTMNYALRGADATTGTLTTFYEGLLPAGKRPMKKEGAIVLGSGGDCCLTNNNLSEGTFYEGAIVTGYPAAATEDAIQANIVKAGYGK
jgi:hypothetical protein